MEKGQVLFLNEKEIYSLITKEEALEIVDKVFKDYANGQVVNPVKLHLPIYPDVDGYINSMPSYNKTDKATGIKVVSVYHDNPKGHGLPATIGTIILHDWETGMPYAIMGGTHVTNIRTGAAAGLKAKYLANEDASVLAVIGAGAQGYSAMDMVMTAMGKGRIKEIRVSDLAPDRRAQYIEKAKAVYPDVNYVSCQSNAEAMESADVALFAAAAPMPLLESCPVKPGCTVICINEMVTPKTIAKFDRFYTDFTDCVLERFNTSGHYSEKVTGRPYEDLTAEMVTCEIGDVMVGKVPGRISHDDKLLTLDVGMGIEDCGVASFVYKRALERGVGQILDFQNL